MLCLLGYGVLVSKVGRGMWVGLRWMKWLTCESFGESRRPSTRSWRSMRPRRGRFRSGWRRGMCMVGEPGTSRRGWDRGLWFGSDGSFGKGLGIYLPNFKMHWIFAQKTRCSST